MIYFTEEAKAKILSFLQAEPHSEKFLFRISASGKKKESYHYQFFLDEEKNRQSDDVMVSSDGFTAIMDRESAKILDGTTVDWSENSNQSGFIIKNSSEKKTLSDPQSQKIQELLENEINPALGGHGGFAELVDVKGSVVFLRLGGGCQGCSMARLTIKNAIETRIKEVMPEITEVVDATNHMDGSKPFFKPTC